MMNNSTSTNGSLCDKDITTDALTFHKQLTNLASLGCLESASQAGLQAFQQLQQSELNHSRQIYDLMNQRGWYNAQPASNQSGTQAQSQSQNQGQSRVLGTMTNQKTR